MIENVLINGLVRSLVLAVLAIGFSLIFGVARILNLAHTAYYMVAAFLVYIVGSVIGLGYTAGVISSFVLTIIIGGVIYKFLIDRVREHVDSVVLATIALAFVFQEVFLFVFGSNYRRVPGFVTGYFEVLGVKLTYQHAVVVCLSILIIIAVRLFLTKTITITITQPKTSNLISEGKNNSPSGYKIKTPTTEP